MIVPENLAKELLASYALITPRGQVAATADEAASIAHEMGGCCVVKALIPIGGRGRAGGVRICQSADITHQVAESLLNQDLLGHKVNAVLVEEFVPFDAEIYVGIVANTANDKIDLILSLDGGVEIENTARDSQHRVYHLPVEPGDLLPVYRVSTWLQQHKIDLSEYPALAYTIVALHRAAADLDAILLEINPLAVCADKRLIVLDAKLEVDDNALSRHPALNALFVASLSPRELRARQLGVSYVPLDGDIGVITSGAGLGMATLDLLQQRGLSPANFLDTGGGISEHMVKGAVELILEPPQVKGAIINLYGGINRMLEAAKGISAALEGTPDLRPIVVKILGNQQEEAWAILKSLSNVHVIRVVQTEAAVNELAKMLEPVNMETLLLNQQTRAIVQGITGKVGRAQTLWMLKAGTPLVAGVTPGRGGQIIGGLPVYDSVGETVERHGANASVIFVPAPYAREAAFEAIQAGLRLVVIVTEHIPVRDTLDIKTRAQLSGTIVIGPNSPGIYIPSIGKLGIMPESIFRKGNIGVAGRSATLSYEVIANITHAGLGQTAAIGVGGDPVVCTEFTSVLELFEADRETAAVVMVGEIGGSAEERAAEFISQMRKPVVALIAGKAATAGKRFGHAGAIIRAGSGGAQHKIDMLRQAGASIAVSPSEIPTLLKQQLVRRPRLDLAAER